MGNKILCFADAPGLEGTFPHLCLTIKVAMVRWLLWVQPFAGYTTNVCVSPANRRDLRLWSDVRFRMSDVRYRLLNYGCQTSW